MSAAGTCVQLGSTNMFASLSLVFKAPVHGSPLSFPEMNLARITSLRLVCVTASWKYVPDGEYYVGSDRTPSVSSLVVLRALYSASVIDTHAPDGLMRRNPSLLSWVVLLAS